MRDSATPIIIAVSSVHLPEKLISSVLGKKTPSYPAPKASPMAQPIMEPWNFGSGISGHIFISSKICYLLFVHFMFVSVLFYRYIHFCIIQKCIIHFGIVGVLRNRFQIQLIFISRLKIMDFTSDSSPRPMHCASTHQHQFWPVRSHPIHLQGYPINLGTAQTHSLL